MPLNSQSFILPTDSIVKYFQYVQNLALITMLCLSPTNPIFKISLALHVGLLTCLFCFYAPIIYFKSLTLKNDEPKGLIPKVLDFLPNLLHKISQLLLNMFFKILSLLKISDGKSYSFAGYLLSFAFISARKLLALLSWCYITPEDDYSTHSKALLLFCLFNLIQYRFIISSDVVLKKTPNISFFEGTKKILKFHKEKNVQLQASMNKFKRNLLFFLTSICSCVIISSMFDTFFENDEHDLILIIRIVKFLFILDVYFSNTLLTELGGLNFNFSRNDSYV